MRAVAAELSDAPGALVISLDFELHWGMRDHTPSDGPYRANFLGVREVIPRTLRLFESHGVAATWATVGFLFARSRADLERFRPLITPRYLDPALSPYAEPVGEDERDDPLHFAPDLIARIGTTPRQEIATHTFSHYYCLEAGQTRDAFAADLASAVAIARESGIALRSIVFPRNQWNPAYDDVLLAAGIRCYRGNPRAWMHRVDRGGASGTTARLARLADAYTIAGGARTIHWSEMVRPSGLVDVAASHFVRPYTPHLRALEPLRLARIERSMRRAAERGEVVHLWWHPHNFGIHVEQNLAALERLLDTFGRLRELTGLRSMSMADAANVALARGAT